MNLWDLHQRRAGHPPIEEIIVDFDIYYVGKIIESFSTATQASADYYTRRRYLPSDRGRPVAVSTRATDAERAKAVALSFQPKEK